MTMLRIAEALGAAPSPLWSLVKQCGITAAVAGLPSDRHEKPWDYVPLLRMKRAYDEQGFTVDVIEARPPLELAKRGGKNAKKRAKVAVARKLAVLMHRLWVTGEVYEPLGYHLHQMEEKRRAA